MRTAQLVGVVAAIALAGCGSEDPSEPATAESSPAAESTSRAWAEKASETCSRQVAAIVRAAEPIPRAAAKAQNGARGGWEALAAHMRRQSKAIEKLYEDLKAIPAPDDRQVDRFLFLYANLAGDSFRAVDAMLYDRRVAQQYVASADAAGRDAHEVAEELGAEACTSWISAS